RAIDVLEENHKELSLGRDDLEWNDFEVDVAKCGVVVDQNALCAHDIRFLARFSDGCPQVGAKVKPNHVEQIEAGCSSCRLQICACASTKMHHLQLVIHHDAGGRVAAEHDLVGRALHFGRRLWSTRVFR